MVTSLVLDWMAPAEAARRLGVTPRRVYALVRDGRLRGEWVGGRLLVGRSSVEARAGSPVTGGRPFSPRRAWALLLLAAGEAPVGLEPDVRSRLGRLAREGDLWSMRARLVNRAQVRRLRAHASDLGRIAAEPGLVRTGPAAAAEAGLTLVAPGAILEAYLDAATAMRLVERYRLQPDPDGNLVLRVVPAEVRGWLAGPVAPRAAVALDLAEDPDPRAQAVAREALGGR